MQNKKKSRFLVNVIGVPSLLFFIVMGDSFIPAFSIFVFFTMLLSMYEWNNLCSIESSFNKFLNFLIMSLVFTLVYLKLDYSYLVLCFVVQIFMLFLHQIFIGGNKPVSIISSSLLGVFFIGVFFSSLILIRSLEYGLTISLMLFMSIWLCDTFAFVFGRAYGIRKIAPSISPNKTIFGSFFGYLSGFFVPLIIYAFYPILDWIFLDYIVCGFIFGVFGQIGDLSISLLKRDMGIKDTSSILQGHGGILDRFDSLSFAAPFLYIFLYLNNLL